VSQLTQNPPASPGRPAPQYVSAEHVVAEMADRGTRRLQRLSVVQILVLAMLAGGFVTVGALFSVLLAVGIGSPGAQRLVEGLGFSAGFFFVILSDAVLFTEANVVLPATILRCHGSPAARLATIARFWALAWAGNLAGAFVVGYAIHLGLHYPPNVDRPAGLGNIAGGAFLVALPFWYALGPARRRALAAAGPDRPADSGTANSPLR
jgi:formate transporter